MADGKYSPAFYELITAEGDHPEPGSSTVKRALAAARSHLDMNVAYVSEFVKGYSVFREVDAPGLENLIKVGDRYSLDDVYCRHIVDGRMPELIPNAAKDPIAMDMPITGSIPIGAHMSVPIRRSDGSVYGMFCCFKFEPDETLNPRDLQVMRAFADIAAFEVSRDQESAKLANERSARIRSIIEERRLSIVYQPIWNVGDKRPIALECLTRFSDLPSRPPDQWFFEAAMAGLRTELELVAMRVALPALSLLSNDISISLNVHPSTIMTGAFQKTIESVAVDRIILEFTEHAVVEDYERLLASLRPLRSRGLRLAVDNAGAGYSSLQHILHLKPELIKLDRILTRGVDFDPVRRALASAMVVFSRDIDTKIIAGGVETESELEALRSLGIDGAQGYFLGRPEPLNRAIELFDRVADTEGGLSIGKRPPTAARS